MLTLPPSCRRQIYHLLGVPTGCLINLNGVPVARRSSSNAEIKTFQSTLNLLLTCRLVSSEVTMLLYQSNAFFIAADDDLTLKALRAIRKTTVPSFRSLAIHLRSLRCHIGSCGTFHSPPIDIRTPLCLMCDRDRELVDTWTSIWTEWAEQLSLHGPPEASLTLGLVADCADYETARTVVQPLSLQGAILSRCYLRLSADPDPSLSNLAKATAQKLTNKPALNQVGFRFLDLPTEVRQRILSYTDLVTPLAEVFWQPSKGFTFQLHQKLWQTRNAYNDHGSTLTNAFELLSEVGEVNASTAVRRAHSIATCYQHSYPSGCYCRRKHSAYSDSCDCWDPPTSIFLVCRSMLEDARQVFYSSNRFILAYDDFSMGGYYFKTYDDVTIQPHRIHPVIFFSDVVPKQALGALRCVEILFPSFGSERTKAYVERGSKAYADWETAIRLVQRHANLGALTLHIFFFHPVVHNEEPQWRYNITPEQVEECRDCVRELLQPLVLLNGRLARFFVDVPNPELDGPRDRARSIAVADAWDYEHQERYDWMSEQYEQWRNQASEDLADEVEKMVMGVEYDAESLGKSKWVISEWYRCFCEY